MPGRLLLSAFLKVHPKVFLNLVIIIDRCFPATFSLDVGGIFRQVDILKVEADALRHTDSGPEH